MQINPNTQEKIQIIKTNAQVFGWMKTARNVLAYLLSAPDKDNFDKRYGTKTNIHLGYVDLDFDSEQRETGRPYSPAPTKVVEHALKVVKKQLGSNLSQYTFCDLGCGLGRVIMLASQYPYMRVTGVDLSAALIKVAKENLAIYSEKVKRHSPMSAIEIDVLKYEWPETDLVLFMYDPFKEPLLKEVLERLHQIKSTNPQRSIYIAYVRSWMVYPILTKSSYIEVLKHYQTISLDVSWSLLKVK